MFCLFIWWQFNSFFLSTNKNELICWMVLVVATCIGYYIPKSKACGIHFDDWQTLSKAEKILNTTSYRPESILSNINCTYASTWRVFHSNNPDNNEHVFQRFFGIIEERNIAYHIACGDNYDAPKPNRTQIHVEWQYIARWRLITSNNTVRYHIRWEYKWNCVHKYLLLTPYTHSHTRIDISLKMLSNKQTLSLTNETFWGDFGDDSLTLFRRLIEWMLCVDLILNVRHLTRGYFAATVWAKLQSSSCINVNITFAQTVFVTRHICWVNSDVTKSNFISHFSPSASHTAYIIHANKWTHVTHSYYTNSTPSQSHPNIFHFSLIFSLVVIVIFAVAIDIGFIGFIECVCVSVSVCWCATNFPPFQMVGIADQ